MSKIQFWIIFFDFHSSSSTCFTIDVTYLDIKLFNIVDNDENFILDHILLQIFYY